MKSAREELFRSTLQDHIHLRQKENKQIREFRLRQKWEKRYNKTQKEKQAERTNVNKKIVSVDIDKQRKAY